VGDNQRAFVPRCQASARALALSASASDTRARRVSGMRAGHLSPPRDWMALLPGLALAVARPPARTSSSSAGTGASSGLRRREVCENAADAADAGGGLCWTCGGNVASPSGGSHRAQERHALQDFVGNQLGESPPGPQEERQKKGD